MRALCSFTLLLVSAISVGLHAADVPFDPLDERGLKKADAQLAENDYRNALRLLFMILRHAERDVTRAEARERLERLGLSSQNIFQLEVEAMKPSELEELLTQIAASVAASARRDADLLYAQKLLTSSLLIRTDSEGNIKPDIATKDTLFALKMLLDYAMGENADGARRAQQMLEAMGVSGKIVEAAKQSVKEDRLRPEVIGELIPAAALIRLKLYHEALRDARDAGADDEKPRRRVAREIGTALLQYIDKEFPDSSSVRRQSDALDFFRDRVRTKPDKF